MKYTFYFIGIVSILTIVVSYTLKIGTGLYCGDLPVVRWKFAIYRGECDDETGCHFYKMENNGVREYFGFRKINCFGEDIYKIKKEIKSTSQDTLPNTTKAMLNGFVREYSADSSEIYDSKFEDINGCKKVVEWKMYNKNYELLEEWEKKYKIDSTQTCDFSAYIIYKKSYKNGKIKLISDFMAGSEESEEEPCGSWEYYDNQGKIIKTIKYKNCDITKFGRN